MLIARNLYSMITDEANTLAPDEYGGGTPPVQFKTGQLCIVCHEIRLSRYNPTKVCGTCLNKLQKNGCKTDGLKFGKTYWAKYFIKVPKRKPISRPTIFG